MHGYNTRKINPKYFEIIHTDVRDDQEFSIVKPKDNPMILFSKVDGSPLASLHLKCQDTNINKGRTLITKRPTNNQFKCDFQGLIDRDNQEFELVITNLCSKGNLNFNIMKSRISALNVQEVNPGGVNEINELRPFESYEVKCDQEDNMSFILNSIKKEVKGLDGSTTIKKVTVKDAEDDVKEEVPEGTYYFLSVVPQIDKLDIVEKFKDTVWDCVDSFVLQKKVEHVPKFRSRGYGGIEEGYVLPMAPSHDTRCCEEPRSRSRGGQELGYRMEFHMDRSNNERYRDSPESSILTNPPDDASGYFGINSVPTSGVTLASVPASISAIDDVMIDDFSEEEMGLELFESSVLPSQKSSVTNNIIQDSFAASVGKGRKIQVNSAQTGIEYAYDVASSPCTIGLSISDKLEFRDGPSKDELIKDGLAIIEDIVKNKSQELLKKIGQIYKEEDCAICLEGGYIDAVYYQCGHQCCHYECSAQLPDNKCPLCRKHITATIRLVKNNDNEDNEGINIITENIEMDTLVNMVESM